MLRPCVPLVLAAGCLVAGCAEPATVHQKLFTLNQAQANYRDDVTGRVFDARSNPVKVEVVRFASLTSTRPPIQYVGGGGVWMTRSQDSLGALAGSRPPAGTTGIQVALVGREVRAAAPLVGSHPAASIDLAMRPVGMLSELSSLRVTSWQEVVLNEARTRSNLAVATPLGIRTVIQWPHGVHEIGSDITFASVLTSDRTIRPGAPIVVLDFSSRFQQRPSLLLTKKPDKDRAFVDEVITYTVTFFNDSPIEASNVAIADVVDEQCEFKPGSETCSRACAFSVEETAEKRPVLIWRLKEPVGAHESGTISYQLVVRKPWVR